MAKGDYKNTMQKLGDMLKTEPVKTPIQEVRPVEELAVNKAQEPKKTESAKLEAHVNFWMPDELMQQLKIHAAISKKTIKQIGIEAFEEYLTKRNK